MMTKIESTLTKYKDTEGLKHISFYLKLIFFNCNKQGFNLKI